jgi:pimeloyl-ACP methyl ester carboxylesterase
MQRCLLLCLLWISGFTLHAIAETLPPLANGQVPLNLTELWGDFNPRLEPLESEVTKEWEQDGIVCRVIRYRIGVFKGKPATMAAFYAFPKGAKHLPAILNLHGGGQSAYLAAVVTNAKLGYASLALNWGGNKMTLADGKIYDGANTDWGALDATHPPQRTKNNHFAGGNQPDEFTLDAVDSPRNDNWFIVTIASRRALTFLEAQPEVDASKIGVMGHSMGGRLTVMLTAIDARVKAAVPSCGGSGDFTGDLKNFPGCTLSKRASRDLATCSENPYIERLKVPTLWFSPTNDFHAHIDNFAYTWRNVPDSLLGLSISPHFNHRHSEDHSLTATLWFEQYLKEAVKLPASPQVRLLPANPQGEASFLVTVDKSQPIKSIRLYASADTHALTRFWGNIPVIATPEGWKANISILDAKDPLFVYADVTYEAPEKYRNLPTPPGVGKSSVYSLSSRLVISNSTQLSQAGVKATARRTRMIDTGAQGWQDWYQLNWGNPTLWTASTRKVKDHLWRGPQGARLAFDINPSNDTIVYVTLTRNDWGAFGPGNRNEFIAAVPLKANGNWVSVNLGLEDFKPATDQAGPPLKDWSTLTDLAISGHATLTKGGVKTEQPSVAWKNPKDIRIRQLRWIGGQYQGDTPAAPELSDEERTKAFNDAIKASLEQERRDREGK